MLIGFDFGSYLTCMFLAFGFVMMMAGFHAECPPQHKIAANTALAFTAVYTVLILLVYFAQVTAVRLDVLGDEALRIMDYKRFGLFFSYDPLGYSMTALATFFYGIDDQRSIQSGQMAQKAAVDPRRVFYKQFHFSDARGVQC